MLFETDFLLRSERFESSDAQFTLNDAFRRNTLFGLELDYNWSTPGRLARFSIRHRL